jgi:ABC-type dipeptide/oligopeptide/nickel transport system ATPase component
MSQANTLHQREFWPGEGEKGDASPRFAPSEVVLKLEHVQIYAVQGKRRHTLVHDLSLAIHRGEMLALVGESGSGKSVTASAIAGLLPGALRVGGGQIVFQGENILPWPEKRKRALRGKRIGYMFQDYQGSFTPFLKIGRQLVETIRSHCAMSFAEAKGIALEWLHQVDLPEERVFHSYPFQLSGGQRQRAALAAAMMLQPDLLIADEPTTALDVLTGERILDLLAMLQRRTGCAVLLISHDLRHVLKRADTIAVMKDGRIVEMGPTETIKRRASHPYTRMLLKAAPLLSDMQAGFAGEEEEGEPAALVSGSKEGST